MTRLRPLPAQLCRRLPIYLPVISPCLRISPCAINYYGISGHQLASSASSADVLLGIYCRCVLISSPGGSVIYIDIRRFFISIYACRPADWLTRLLAVTAWGFEGPGQRHHIPVAYSSTVPSHTTLSLSLPLCHKPRPVHSDMVRCPECWDMESTTMVTMTVSECSYFVTT